LLVSLWFIAYPPLADQPFATTLCCPRSNANAISA
jgi:hypothetical protein